MRIGDAGRIRWVRVGRWLLAATPVGGPRVYRVLTRNEQAKALRCEAWEPDVALWGGKPDAVLTDYPGRYWKGGPSEGKLAGLGEEADTYLSGWDPPAEGDGNEKPPPEAHFFRPGGLTITRDRLTFTDRELVINYHQAKGRAVITCGWCESKKDSRSVQTLLRWFHTHDCFTSGAADR
jgi:hypothetical protein